MSRRILDKCEAYCYEGVCIPLCPVPALLLLHIAQATIYKLLDVSQRMETVR